MSTAIRPSHAMCGDDLQIDVGACETRNGTIGVDSGRQQYDRWKPTLILLEDNFLFSDRTVERFLAGVEYQASKRTNVNDRRIKPRLQHRILYEWHRFMGIDRARY